MDQHALVLRAAEPTLEEGLVYGRYLNELAPGFRYTIGRRAVDVLGQVYVQPGHNLSFEHAVYAERDGEIVGLVAGFTGAQLADADENLRRALRDTGLGRARIAALAKWMRYFGPTSDDEYYVWVLIVSDGLRGQGLGTMMMDFAADRARQAGATRLCLDAEAKNDRARRFYERRGMAVESKWPRLPLAPAVIVRMGVSL